MSAVSASRLAAPLTPMQRKVVRLCALGCSVKEAALILGLSPSTVDNHKTRAMKSIRVTNIARLARYAIREGISALDDELTLEEHARLIDQNAQHTKPR